MSRYAYVNGRYLPMREATVHIEDRGYQFADGVYEVCEVRAGRLIDERRHLARLQRSLGELRIRAPMSAGALRVVVREVVARNRIGYGAVYLQVTRGVARRDHAFPAPEVPPCLVVTARPLNSGRNEALAAKGIAVISVPDNRWDRVDIKTIGLLPNVLARQAAIDQGARDAWFVDKDGAVTVGAGSLRNRGDANCVAGGAH
jgi:D-alanine transaminase